jgi:carbohydrate-selective porin OprB
MESTRRQRLKYGFYINAEQALTKDIGLFGRASWNDGQNEILSFTDVDASLSGGIAIKGTRWGRPDDTVGIGGALNFLSEPHRGRRPWAPDRRRRTHLQRREDRRDLLCLHPSQGDDSDW